MTLWRTVSSFISPLQGDAEAATGETATFEAVNSTLTSAITSGAMFYFTNTTANVVLSGTILEFDSSKANLMAVQGNDSNNWGTAGSNGADVTFTGLEETLNGNIDVDTISSLDLYLLNSTTYTGATSISTNAVNTRVSEAPLTVNLDSTSTWVVTGDSTVTNLNAESGAVIVDAQGKTISIIADGTTVVSGDSAYTIKVTGSYKAIVTTDNNNALSTSYIDRTEFDSYYAMETAFSTNATSDTITTAPVSNANETSIVTAGTQNETESNSIALYIVVIVVIVLGVAGVVGYTQIKSKRNKN